MASLQDVLQLLLIEEPKNVEVTPRKEDSIQGNEETSAEPFEQGFQFANKNIKGALFRFLIMAFVTMIHQKTSVSI